MVIKYLIVKEFKQTFRDAVLPRIMLMFPILVMLVFPWAVNLEVKNINLAVVDNCKGSYSRRLVEKAVSSGYFRLVDVAASYDEAMKGVERGTTDAILEIPATFDETLINEKAANILISANTVNGTKGSFGGAYLSAIAADFNKDILAERGMSPPSTAPKINVEVQNRFNPHMEYKVFMVPALMVMVLTMLCGFLPALNIVSEKEKGTIEQINVTPVHKFTFILAKLIPYWIMGITVLTICFGLARLIYGISPVGSLFTICLYSILYILTVSGIGLIISNYAGTMQQAMFVIFFIIMILILMSGLFTPVSSMPEWAQTVASLNPLTYFIQVMRQVYLKGSTIADLVPQALALAGFALFFNTWAILSYRKRG